MHPGDEKCWRLGCKKTIDCYGDHLLLCPYRVGPRNCPHIRRHNRLVTIFAKWIRRAGFNLKAEHTHLHETKQRPDITIFVNEKPTSFIEVTVVSGRPSWRSKKSRRYSEYVRKIGAKLYIAALTVVGEWIDEEACNYFEDLVAVIANRSGVDVGSKKKHFFGEVASTLSTNFALSFTDRNPLRVQ